MIRMRSGAVALAVSMLSLAAIGCGGSAGNSNIEIEPVQENSELAQARALGDQYANSQLWDQAITQYEKALAIDETAVKVYPSLAYALLKSERLEEATKIYTRYVSLDPNNCEAHSSLGFAYVSQDQMDMAMKSYEKALELCPEDAALFNNVGRAYASAGMQLEAIEAFRRAIELNPNDIATYESLAQLQYERKLYPDAIATYEAILSHPDHGKPGNWVAWADYRVGTMYNWAESCEPAIAALSKVVANSEASDDMVDRSWRTLGSCYEKTGQNALAIDAYENVVARNPDKAVYFYRLGDLLNDMGRNGEAIEKVRAGISVDASGCPAHGHCVMGRAYEKLGGVANFKRAEREFRKAAACGDPRFEDYARQQIERQKQLVKIEELKKKKAEGY